MQRVKELSKIWFAKAKDDLSWAEDSFKTKHFSGTCFLSQQTAEKCLKSYLFFKEEKLIRTHNLLRLLFRCKKFDSDFEKLKTAVKTLNIYYTDTRYPDIWDISRFENQKLAEEALGLAKKIVDFVEKQITY